MDGFLSNISDHQPLSTFEGNRTTGLADGAADAQGFQPIFEHVVEYSGDVVAAPGEVGADQLLGDVLAVDLAVTQLSVPRVVGLMMGGFWLATAFSEVLAAQFGKLASLDIPESGAIDTVEAAGKYGHLFQLMAWIGLGAALVFFVLAPLLRRWMHGLK